MQIPLLSAARCVSVTGPDFRTEFMVERWLYGGVPLTSLRKREKKIKTCAFVGRSGNLCNENVQVTGEAKMTQKTRLMATVHFYERIAV